MRVHFNGDMESKKRPSDLFRVGLLMDRNLLPWRQVLRGLGSVPECEGWLFHTALPGDPWSLRHLRDWRPHVVVTAVPPSADVSFGRAGMISIDPSAALRMTTVSVDLNAAGQVAAEHLLEKGLVNLARIDSSPNPTPRSIEAGFDERVARAKANLFCINPRGPFRFGGMSLSTQDRLLAKRIAALPRPLGIGELDGRHGLWLTQACRLARLRIPEDVAFVGVCVDEVESLLCHPPLSVALLPWEQVGHEVARVIAQFAAGQPLPRSAILLPPRTVLAKVSSDIVAADSIVATAARFIRERASETIAIDDIARIAGVSRRSLEIRFRRVMNRSLLQHIIATRVEIARDLLVRTVLPLKAIAVRSGLLPQQNLCSTFRKHLGMTPREYRMRFSAPKPSPNDSE